MAQVPQIYPIQPSEATASYDYADLQEGTGITIYNLAQAQLSGSVFSYILTRQDLYSDATEVSGACTIGKTSDLDYDVTFARPQNLKGTAYLNISHGVLNASGYLKAIVRKWDGTTETDIAEAFSRTIGTNGLTYLMPIVIPLTHFKVSETLRLTIEAWNDDNDVGDIFSYGIDPQDRTTKSWLATRLPDGITTIKSSFHVPFVLKT